MKISKFGRDSSFKMMSKKKKYRHLISKQLNPKTESVL